MKCGYEREEEQSNFYTAPISSYLPVTSSSFHVIIVPSLLAVMNLLFLIAFPVISVGFGVER